jgi:hypothetical protein
LGVGASTPDPSTSLDPQKPLHGGSQIRYLIVGLISILYGLPDPVLDVVFEQDQRLSIYG